MATLYYADFEASGSLPGGWNFGAGLDIATSSKLNGANCLRNNATATSPASYYATVDSASGNVVVDAVFMGENIGTNTGFQLILGCNDSNPANLLTTANSYRAALAMGSTVTQWSLNRRNAGTDTVIATLLGANQILKAGAKYHGYLTRNGSALKVEIQQISDPANPGSDGYWLNTSVAWQSARTHCMSGTDGSPLASTGGYCGVRFGGGSSVAYVDDFRISDLVPDGGGVTVAANDANWVDSPGNVDVRSSSLCVLTNWGAERRIGFTGTACAATFDMSLLTASTMLAANYPKIKWSIDNKPWQTATVAAVVSLASGLASGTHSLRLALRGAVTFAPGDSSTQFDRWVLPVSAARLTGLTIDSGAASAPVPASLAARERRMLFFGNSMTAGSQTLGNLPTSDIDSMDGMTSWIVALGEALNADVGNCAWNAQSYTGGGTGGVPKFRDNATPANSTYMWITQGRARSFAGITDVWLCHGVIESSSPASDIIATMAHLRALLDPGAKLWHLVPFGGRWDAEIAAAVASYKSGGDELAEVIDLGEPGRLGMPETSAGNTGPTLQAPDGYHPGAERNAQFGGMIAVQVVEIEADMTPAQIREAIGLSEANLDTQLSGLLGQVNTRATPDQVNAQVLDVLTVDTFAEVSAVPPATTSILNMLRWCYARLRNKNPQTATLSTLRNDADNATIGTAAVSDDGTTTTLGKWTS